MKYSYPKQRALGLIIVGLMITASMTLSLIDASLFLKKAVRGEGTIISVVHHQWRRGGWVIKVRYQPAGFQAVQATTRGNSTSSVGQSVSFLYDPDNYQKVRSLGMKSQYPWVGILMILVGLSITGFGLVWFRKAKLNESSTSKLDSPLIKS